jgi:hypothetical protein
MATGPVRVDRLEGYPADHPSGIFPTNEMELHKQTMNETLKRILVVADSGKVRISDHRY